MRKLVVLIAVFVMAAMVVMAGTAMAVPKGKNVDYDAKMGKVTFSGDTHAEKGLGCKDCHPGIFAMKAAAGAFAAPHKDGESCGACHNGQKSFSAKKDCKMCHVK